MLGGGFTQFREITTKDETRVPVMPGKDLAFDLEKVLPLELIRQHTKTDDNPAVTDELIILYRDAAFEAAEQYTGRIWTRTITMEQPIARSGHHNRFRRRSTINLDFPSVDGVVYLFGGGMLMPLEVRVPIGTRRVSLPVVQEAVDVAMCCGRDGLGENYGITAMYRTGFASPEKIPAGIRLGVLKYIAWAIKNAGDVIMTVKNTVGGQSDGITGTNNGAWASGAIEEWRIHVKDAI